MAAEDINPEKHRRRQLWGSLFKMLVAPVVLLAFFLIAPDWLDANIHQRVIKDIRRDYSLFVETQESRIAAVSALNFQELSEKYPANLAKLHDWLLKAGYAEDFQQLHWALEASQLLLALLAVGLGAILLLNLLGGLSRAALAHCYRLAWWIAVPLAIVTVALVVPLFAYGLFELTILLSNRYYPIILGLLLLGGVVALAESVKIVLSAVPLEFGEPLAREVTPDEAPELWQTVEEAAQRLQSVPPDHIIIGASTNFYVTEMPVRHEDGRTFGKTLFLSYPLMKLMTVDEVIAVIGHELGHFIGKDTALTRIFYPRRVKVKAITSMLASSGWTGRPAFELLNFFHWCFEGTASRHARARELQADCKGAELTSPEIMGRALVRLHLASAAMSRGFRRITNPDSAEGNPYNISLRRLILAAGVTSDPKFWIDLFHRKQAHPMDTHPSLQTRLVSLKTRVSVAETRAMGDEEIFSAFDAWFGHREEIFERLVHLSKGGAREAEDWGP